MATATKAKKSELTLTAYCMKTKERDVPIQDAVISLNKGKYIAKGHDGNGNKITTILSEKKATECIDAGLAEAGEGMPGYEAPTKSKKK